MIVAAGVSHQQHAFVGEVLINLWRLLQQSGAKVVLPGRPAVAELAVAGVHHARPRDGQHRRRSLVHCGAPEYGQRALLMEVARYRHHRARAGAFAV